MENNAELEKVVQERLANLTPLQRELLAKKMNSQKDVKPPNILVIKEGDNSEYRPIFCMHPPLGVTGYFHNIANHLDDRQPVYGIQCPAFSSDREAHDNMHEMAKDYLQQIKTIQSEPPYQIIGHSSGGFIAYEIARLINDKEQLPNLFIIDQSAPLGHMESLADAYTTGDDLDENVQTLYLTCWLVSMAHGVELTFSIDKLASCESRDEKYSLAGQFLKEAGFLPQSAELSMVSKVMHMIANHFKADTDYIESFNQALPENKYDGNLVLFRSTEATNWQGLDFVTEADSSTDSGWQPFCSNPLEVIDIPNSDHISLLLEPAVKDLAAELEKFLYSSAE